MSSPLAYYNGQLVPVEQISIPIFDAGFVQGTTVAEQIRTFGGKLFRLDDHLSRFERSLATVGVELPYSMTDLKRSAEELAERNHSALKSGDDLALCLFATPGAYASFAASPGTVPAEAMGPQCMMHTYPLPFSSWANLYESGQPLRYVSIREVPTSCWPAALKCRSRMHYYLADLEARQSDPESRALLLDVDGYLAEASTASVFLFREDEGFVAPREEDVLPSISLQTIREFASQREIPFIHRRIERDEVFECEEVLLCSTSPCVLPVTSIDGNPIGGGKPGEKWAELISDWNQLAGYDVMEQARRFSSRA